MNKGCRHQLNDGQNTDLKNHFFDQITVFQQCICSIRDSFRKIKPGYKSRCQKQYIRYLYPTRHHLASRIKHHIKYNPVHDNRHDRLHQCPQKSKIGSSITLFKIILRKLPDQLPVLEKLLRNNKNTVIINTKNSACQQKQRACTYFLKILGRLICQRIIVKDHHGCGCRTYHIKECNSHRLGDPPFIFLCFLSYFLHRIIRSLSFTCR